ncbi:MAG: ABC transporter substrate-binding protein [Oscillospiraceae bacterium]|nr:ABC transporter substrate-binding protein [Oscillospiraceae bacterium]
MICALAAVTLLASCAVFGGGDDENLSGEPEPTSPDAVITFMPIPAAVPDGDGRFSLRYNKNATFNPLVGTDTDNMLASGLMYESLFVLNADFSWSNRLCESYETDDAVTYDFTFVEGILHSDGTELSPYDFVYSLNTARRNSKYVRRLRNIDTVSVVGSRVIRVTLKAPDARLPALLDIPIIKDGTAGTAPRGTGPYKYDEEGAEPMLVKNEYYRAVSSVPVDRVYLVTCTDAEMGERFTERVVDLFIDDPNGTTTAVRRDHETRYYDTTVLQFIGFNPRAAAIDNAQFRTVISLAVDREAIVRDILGARATVAPLALPMAYRLYDKTWEDAQTGDTLTRMSELLTQMGLADADSDTYLEFPIDGEYIPFSLDFIVSNENAARAAAAKCVADALRHVGINVTLRELAFSDFEIALEAGNYDLYYGETKITANFDFSPLIAPGGSLNFGGISGYGTELDAFAAARGDFAERNAARELVIRIRDEVPFVPIAYLQYAIHSGRNEITGIIPSQSGIFWNVADWEIDVK